MNISVGVLFFADINFIYYLQLSTERIEIPYVLLVYEADKFCNLTLDDSLFDQLCSIRSHYPTYTVCYLTNRLFSYINKRWVIYFHFISTSILVAIAHVYVLVMCVHEHICYAYACQSISNVNNLILGFRFNQTPKTNCRNTSLQFEVLNYFFYIIHVFE